MTEPASPFPIGLNYPALPKHLPVGGKARGLSQLAAFGMHVPDAYVVIGAQAPLAPGRLEQLLDSLGGGPVAVRSSAEAEDGAEASFAGQFDTVLGVRGPQEVAAAIAQCVASVENAHASAYTSDRSVDHGAMAVVIQRMIDPQFSGVTFTVDPVSHRRDRLVIDVVAGLGEKLVSGEAEPDHFVLSPKYEIISETLAANPTNISENLVTQIAREARQIAASFEAPLDLEWAVDQDGTLWWLQARPITTLGADPRELDVPPLNSDDVLTRCNVGEIMPGAVTPLSLSTTGRGIEFGIQAMLVNGGALEKIEPGFKTLSTFYGHLFINLSTLAKLSGAVVGSNVEQIGLAICGRPIKALKPVDMKPLPRRLWNAVSYFRYVTGATKQIKRRAVGFAAFSIDREGSSRELYIRIGEALHVLDDIYDLHLQSSGSSGAGTSALHLVFSKGKPPEMEHYAHVAALLSALGDLEGADLISGLKEVSDAIAATPGHEKGFLLGDKSDALAWLKSEHAGEGGKAFAHFLATHGHRSFRELEMRQPGWGLAPAPLIDAFRTSVRAQITETHNEGNEDLLKQEPWYVRMLITRARDAVQNREQTKALLVHVTDQFKQTYRKLADLLVEEGLLLDQDHIFFLTHEEIENLFAPAAPSFATLAANRAKVHDAQAALVFPDVFQGEAVPIEASAVAELDGVLTGHPVSGGVIEARARVARTPEEAALIEPGEILVAPVTDIGWTPYFRLISGVITDVGSPVSHGAVIAREYGLPAIVNTRIGTQVIKSGDLIRLDASRGTVEVLERA